MGHQPSRANETVGPRRCPKKSTEGERTWDPLPHEKKEGINGSSWGRERDLCQSEVRAQSNFDVPKKDRQSVHNLREKECDGLAME